MARSALGAAQDHDELSSLTRDLHMFQDHASSASPSLGAEACAPAAMPWLPLDAMVDAVCGRVTDTVSTSPESSEKSLYKLSKACEKSRQVVPTNGAKMSSTKMSEMAASGRHATVAHAVAASLALRGGAAEATSAIHAARAVDPGFDVAVASALRSARLHALTPVNLQILLRTAQPSMPYVQYCCTH